MPEKFQKSHRVVIVGGGFGGLYAAQALRGPMLDVTLVDRRNFHLFQPLLYQVATGGLSPADIAHPLRSILKRQRNVTVLLGEVVDFDLGGKRVVLVDGELGYDSLVVAAGAVNHYFGHDDWQRRAPGLKSIEDATEVRSRILVAFEAAERERSPELRRAWLTFAIVGAGPTGVELAGAIGEIANYTLKHDFRAIRPSEARVLLIEAGDRVLPTYRPSLSARADADLAALGVTVRTGTLVQQIDENALVLQCGDRYERIDARTVIWAAGIRANPLAAKLAAATGLELDRQGRIPVTGDLTLRGAPDVYVIGDMARYEEEDSKPLPGVAPVAMQQGAYVARRIIDRAKERRGKPTSPFRYRDRGSMATIGRSRAVADLGWLAFGGLPAWLAWLFIHLMYLVEFENRMLVLWQWGWNYFTWNRGARLITGETHAR
jgi:NADH dehydrogenase